MGRDLIHWPDRVRTTVAISPLDQLMSLGLHHFAQPFLGHRNYRTIYKAHLPVLPSTDLDCTLIL